MALEFKDPPSDNRGPRRGHYNDVVAELRANPGKWALVGENVGSGVRVALVSRGCEVRTHGRPEYASHRLDVYARWPES